jgi:hypothetical protein
MRGQMTHPDTDLLAEFRAGLIAGRRGRRIGAHVAGCDRCAALGDRLAGVSALLAGVPPPVMPPGVARRLDAVLAAEAERKAGPGRAGGDGLAGRAAGARPARRRGFRRVQVRLLAPAAVVLAAAGYGLSQIGRGPSPAPSPAPRAALMRPARYLSVVTTGTDYQRATIRQQLEAELRPTTPAPSGQPASLQVRACVLGLTSKTSAISAIRVEKARFEGRPALIIIASTTGAENVWVADPGCSLASGDVLYSTALPVQDPESGLSDFRRLGAPSHPSPHLAWSRAGMGDSA